MCSRGEGVNIRHWNACKRGTTINQHKNALLLTYFPRFCFYIRNILEHGCKLAAIFRILDEISS